MNGVGTIFSNFLPEISLTSAINTAPLNDIAVKEIIPRRQISPVLDPAMKILILLDVNFFINKNNRHFREFLTFFAHTQFFLLSYIRAI